MKRWRLATVVSALSLAWLSGIGINPVANSGPGDRSILSGGVLMSTDVPSSWDAQKQNDTTAADYAGIPDCKRARAAVLVAHRAAKRAASEGYFDPTSQVTGAADIVYAFTTTKAAQSFIGTFRSRSSAQCIAAVVDRSLHTQGGQVLVDQPPSIGQQALRFRVVAAVSTQTSTLHLNVDQLLVQAGRAVMVFQFINPDVPNPLEEAIATKVTQRIAAPGA